MPQACVILASGERRAWKSAWVEYRNGEPPTKMNRSDSRAFLVVRGDVKMDTIMVGTIGISVIWNFSSASRYCFKSNLRIMYTDCCSRNAQPDINGTAKL